MLSHLKNPRQIVSHAKGLVSPGGRLIITALTRTNHPIGALLGWTYTHRLHAAPIDPTILADPQPTHLQTGLFGLTTVADYHHDPGKPDDIRPWHSQTGSTVRQKSTRPG